MPVVVAAGGRGAAVVLRSRELGGSCRGSWKLGGSCSSSRKLGGNWGQLGVKKLAVADSAVAS